MSPLATANLGISRTSAARPDAGRLLVDVIANGSRILGIDSSALLNFLHGERLSLATSSTGTDTTAAGLASDALNGLRVPMTTDGFPDFDAIIANGGTVKGAVPPGGSPMTGYSSDHGNVVVYAAIIDLGDGSEPFFVKGGDAQSEIGGSSQLRV